MPDWRRRHDDYDEPGSRLHLRLLVVRDLIQAALDDSAEGEIRVISICAGQGRDIVVAAARHRRCEDVRGRLIELDPVNSAAARASIAASGLRLEVHESDAGISDAYLNVAPADLVLCCGVFGNISVEDIERTIRALPSLCAERGRVIWTRAIPDEQIIPAIQTWFREAGFDNEQLVANQPLRFGIGVERLAVAPMPLEPGRRFFSFATW